MSVSKSDSLSPAGIPVRRYKFSPRDKVFKPCVTERFIQGPIPYDWVKRANQLPGKAGSVGLSLWFLKGVKKSDTFILNQEFDALTGCGRKAIYHALEKLEHAGLIRVVSREGGRPEVTILYGINERSLG